jgi:hypothetical protein
VTQVKLDEKLNGHVQHYLRPNKLTLSDLHKMGFEALFICLTNIFKTLSEQCTVCEVDNAPAFKLNF